MATDLSIAGKQSGEEQCAKTAIMRGFAPEIQIFGKAFVQTQRLRHAADYDPDARFSRHQVNLLIDEVKMVISGFNIAERRQRRAFSIYVLFRLRP